MRTAIAILACACDSQPMLRPPPMEPPPPSEAESVLLARERFPRLFDLQVGVVQKTCSPNPGVCHNDNNYPDLRTFGSLLGTLMEPCNIEIPDPLQGWDSCERKADVVFAEGFRSEIAWVEAIGPGEWRLGLRRAPERSGTRPFSAQSATGAVLLMPLPEWRVEIALVAGQSSAALTVRPDDPFVLEYVDAEIATLIGGDPNRNGVYGAESPAETWGALVVPGSLARSYLWGRITGTVPGSRMPLANEPLDNAAYVAIACWIEGLGSAEAEDPIDYDACAYAKAPLDPAIE